MSEMLVRMPKLADTLVEGTLGQWLKQVGDQVSQGEPLASIETDKVTTEISSPEAGTLLEVLVAEGQTVPVETPIARIGTPSAATASPSSPDGQPAGAGPTRLQDPGVVSSSAGGAPAPRPTPVAARLLAEHGLEAGQIAARSARVTKQDVLRHLSASGPSSATDATNASGTTEAREVTQAKESKEATPSLISTARKGPPSLSDGVLRPLTPMRRAIAEHMTRSFQTIPHGQTVMAADLTHLVAWREQNKHAFQHNEGARLTFTVLFVHALASQLARYTHGPVHLGVAVALDGGLIVPVVRGADALSLGATARGIADLAARARGGKLAPGETQGAQMTVTNVGSFGNLTAAPLVPLTQMGILGPGLVEQRPLPGPDNGLRLGWRCLLSLMFDRRALDDFAADRLLRSVVTELERIPEARYISSRT